MTLLNFIKPDRVVILQSDNFKGVFEFRPLEPGFGLTIGNAIRRVLLSSLEGYAITSVLIDGVSHEFSSISGVREDVTEIILNLKQLCFKSQIEDTDSEVITINLSGKERLTAGDIGDFSTAFQVLNPDLVILNCEKSVKLNLTLTVEKGRGYVPAEENKKQASPVGAIAIDSIYTPIKNIKYSIENVRVEQRTDYEKLLLEILTDGSIHPKDALMEATKILIQHFMLFSDERIILEVEAANETEVYDEESVHMRQLLKARLSDMDLSVRALNCLKAADVETLGDLVSYTKDDLLKVRNFGKKSLVELSDVLESKGLKFGMDISKYGLDKE